MGWLMGRFARAWHVWESRWTGWTLGIRGCYRVVLLYCTVLYLCCTVLYLRDICAIYYDYDDGRLRKKHAAGREG